jgi:hypothetical protein
MNANEKYKNAIDGVHFSPDFEINLKRRLRGETLITMTQMPQQKKSPLRVAMLAGMSIAACFVCFFAVKIASERLDGALVNEPAVTSIETEYTSFTDETTALPGAVRYSIAVYDAGTGDVSAAGAAAGAAVANGESAEDRMLYDADAAAPDTYLSGINGIYGIGTAAATYRPAVALEGLLPAFDTGNYIVTYENGNAPVVVNNESIAENSDEKGEGVVSDDASTPTANSITTSDYTSTLRVFLEKITTNGSKQSFSELKTGTEQYRIDIKGEDSTLLYSVWVFDNCVLVERFAPDGLMKCYVEITQ